MSSTSADPGKAGRPWPITTRLTLLYVVSASAILLSIGFGPAVFQPGRRRRGTAGLAPPRRNDPAHGGHQRRPAAREALAEEKGVRLVCQGQGHLHADALLLKRALGNLLLNALQHTPAGGEIRWSLHPADDGSAEVRVQDNGCGIAAEHLPKLFDRFYRVDPARSEEGTGLGLAIVKSIMDLHGGAVAIASQPGLGTTASLRFPAPPAPGSTPGATVSEHK